VITVRHRIGTNEGEVIGCSACGEVETLYDGAQHGCKAASYPTAATISSTRLAAVEATPAIALASPASRPSLRAVMLAAPLHD
jgi:hypothetical protein